MKNLQKWLIAVAIMLGIVLGVTVARAQTAHQSSLSWTYTQGSDPAVGFFVYRELSTASTYTQLNATALSLTTLSYTDTTVTAGDTYNYYVTAVDANGNQSAPSNTVNLVIPGNPAAPVLTGSAK